MEMAVQAEMISLKTIEHVLLKYEPSPQLAKAQCLV